jgi:hypothetical protein
MFVDKLNNPITVEEFERLKSDQNYNKIGYIELSNGYRISTVWLGLDHSFGSGPPLLFETMVFPKDSLSDLDCERYTTEEEARLGHELMVQKWENK